MSSESDDDYHATRYVNRKVRSNLEVEVSDLVAAGFIAKDNPTSHSALEDSLSIDLDHAAKKLKKAKDKQDNLQNYLNIAQAVKKGNTSTENRNPKNLILILGTINLDLNLEDHQAVEKMINTAVNEKFYIPFIEK